MIKSLKAVAAALLIVSGCGSAEPSGDLIPSLQRLAATNNPEAIYHLGMAYQTGTGLPKTPNRAFESFRQAASLGDVLASYKLGCFYAGQEGDLIKSNPELALRHKLVAAEAGYALAQQDVAAHYAEKGDIPTAVAWLEKAAAQGWADALATYASIHNGAPGVAPNPAKTAAYFELFLAMTDASGKQRDWLQDFKRDMSPKDQKLAAEIVRSYRPAPSPLTVRGLSGQRAAMELVARTR